MAALFTTPKIQAPAAPLPPPSPATDPAVGERMAKASRDHALETQGQARNLLAGAGLGSLADIDADNIDRKKLQGE